MEYSGYVLDETGDAPIGGATITLVDANNKIIKDASKNPYAVTTDSTGKYIVNPPVAGRLGVKKKGFKSTIVDFGSNAILKKDTNLDKIKAATDILKKVNAVFADSGMGTGTGTTGTKLDEKPKDDIKPKDNPKPPKEPMTTPMKVVIGVTILAFIAITVGVIYQFQKGKPASTPSITV